MASLAQHFRATALKRFLVLGAAIAVVGCSGAAAPTARPTPALRIASHDPNAVVALGDEAVLAVDRAPASGADARAAAGRMNSFAFDLYRTLGPGNAIYSPASISLALGLARAGARGETADQMDRVMSAFAAPANLSSVNSLDQRLAAVSGSFADSAGTKRPVLLKIANTSFAQLGLGFNREYLATLAATYGAGVQLCDYIANPEAARGLINGWVARQTADRIKELVPQGEIDDSTRLTLVNAVYMKAPWSHQFAKELTKDAPFNLVNGSSISVPTMFDTFEAPYAAGPGWRAVELPYVGGSLAMTVVVPDDLAAFERTLDATRFETIVSSLQEREITIGLPKFKLETRTSLRTALETLGMSAAFNPQKADFSGITSELPLVISNVIHQANIDVDETGTEASAATGVMMSGAAVMSPPVTFSVDRPFIFALRDVTSGAVVFVGRVVDPSQS